MSLALRSRAKSIAWVCTLAYFASYLMRINFAVMLVKICSDLQASKTDLAVVITLMILSIMEQFQVLLALLLEMLMIAM